MLQEGKRLLYSYPIMSAPGDGSKRPAGGPKPGASAAAAAATPTPKQPSTSTSSSVADAAASDFEAQVNALAQLEQLTREIEAVRVARESHGPAGIKALRASIAAKCSLKADLKKSTAFVKRLKAITPDGLQQCIRETETLNLNQYISEIISALLETQYKSTDTPSIVRLCVLLHERYEDFTAPMVSGLRSAILSDPSPEDRDAGKRKRIQLRLIVELFEAGVVAEDEVFVAITRHLLGRPTSGSGRDADKANAKGTAPVKRMAIDLGGLVTFVKYAAEVLMGRGPKRVLDLLRAAGTPSADPPTKLLASRRTAFELNELITEAAQQVSADLVVAFKDLRRLEKRFEKDKFVQGSLTEGKQTELEDMQKLHEKLLSSMTSLSQSLNIPMPDLREEDAEAGAAAGSAGISVWDAGAGKFDFGPYGDAESKAFYEDLPDLLQLVPLSTLGLTPEQAAALREKWEREREEDLVSQEQEDIGFADVGASDVLVPEPEDAASDAGAASSASSVDGASGLSVGQRIQALLTEKLPECNNKVLADEFAVSFCYVSRKNSRKRLAAALADAPKNRPDMVASYARIAASLSRLYPDLGKQLVSHVHSDFLGKYHAKGQFDMDYKVRTIRMVGELVKFRVAPPIMAFRIFTRFFEEFFGHNVHLCAYLLEACGRYLYLMPMTHARMSTVLETVVRLRGAKNLDSQQQMALESAYFTVKPPERVAREKKVRSKLELYIRHLLLSNLAPVPSVIDKIIRQLRKLPWSSPEDNVEKILIKVCIKVAKTKYVSIHLVADIVAALIKHRPRFVVKLVDTVLEELYRGMQLPHKRDVQKLLGVTKLLGELFNYSVVSSNIVFDALYWFLSHGHPAASTSAADDSTPSRQLPSNLATMPMPEAIASLKTKCDATAPSDIDAPADLFRAQLVVELVRACAPYFMNGILKDRLSRFLLFFQQYLLMKTSVPTHIEFAVLDLFDELEQLALTALNNSNGKGGKGSLSLASLTLSFPRYGSLEEVNAEISKLTGGDVAAPEDADGDADDDQNAGADAHAAPGLEEEGVDEGGDGRIHIDGESDGEDDDEQDDDEEEEEEEDDGELCEANAAAMMAKLRMQEEEDEEFEKAFKSAMQQSVNSSQHRAASTLAKSQNLAMPAVLPRPKNLIAPSEDDAEEERKDEIQFKLLSRDSKGRFETRQFAVSKDDVMVHRLTKAEQEHRLERQRIKDMVLRYEKEEEAQGGRASANVPVAYLGGRDILRVKTTSTTLKGSSYRKEDDESSGPAMVGAPREQLDKDEYNLSSFLAEASASEIRRLQPRPKGPPPAGPGAGQPPPPTGQQYNIMRR